MALQTKEIMPTSEHTHTIILLHGRDSNAEEFAADFMESQTSNGKYLTEIFPTFKWVFPSARMIFAKRFRCDMSQWFDMWDTECPDTRKEDQTSELNASIDSIVTLVEQESALIGKSQVILGGISQGCATAACTLLKIGRLGGFVGFSRWMPTDELRFTAGFPCAGTPLFLAHFQDDEMVVVEHGRSLWRDLGFIGGVCGKWLVYEEGGHWINEPQGVDDLVEFLGEVGGVEVDVMVKRSYAEMHPPPQNSVLLTTEEEAANLTWG